MIKLTIQTSSFVAKINKNMLKKQYLFKVLAPALMEPDVISETRLSRFVADSGARVSVSQRLDCSQCPLCKLTEGKIIS